MAKTDDADLSRKERREAAREQRRAEEAARLAAEARKKQLAMLGGVLVLAVAVVAIIIAISSSGGHKKPTKAIPTGLFAGIPQAGLVLGNPNAPVTLEEFADPQCPFCDQFALNVEPYLVSHYVRTGKIKVVWEGLHFIGPDSYTAQKFAHAAGRQNLLWSFMYAFYANQQEENSGYVTQSFLAGVAAKVAGLNVAKAQSDQNLPAVATQITLADQLANQQGISSTPSFLIGKTGGTLSLLNYSSLTVGGFTPQINAALKNAGVAV